MKDSAYDILVYLNVVLLVVSVFIGMYQYFRPVNALERKRQRALDERERLAKKPEAASSSSSRSSSSSISSISSPSSSRFNLSPRSGYPPTTTTTATPSNTPDRWGKRAAEMGIFALGAEHVYVHNVGKLEAATVAIVDVNGDPVYSRKIFHPKSSFASDPWTRNNLDTKEGYLEDGVHIEIIRRCLLELLENALVILVDEWKDWNSLRITPQDLLNHNITTFDLQTFWREQTGQGTKHGRKDYQPIALHSLMQYYFNWDIYKGIHSADVDARAIMYFFREVIYNPNEKLIHDHDHDEMEEREEKGFERFRRNPP